MRGFRTLLVGASLGLLNLLGVGTGAEHVDITDPFGLGRLAAQRRAEAERAARFHGTQRKAPGVTLVAGDKAYRASNGTVVSAFMAPMDFGHGGARPASSYRGARRNEAKIQRRGYLSRVPVPA